jgi:3-hydroxyisobutyrate dehydrogenase
VTTLFVGLGRMGTPMARMLAPVDDLVLFDVGPSAGALGAELDVPVLESLSALPEGVDTLVLMLPNSAIVEDVLVAQGVLDRLPPGSLVIDMSSSVPASTQRLAETAAARGVGYVDAPVSGGVAKATDGTLSVIVGGAPDDVARAVPHIEPMAGSIVVVGPPGAGHAAKALNNLLSATNIAAAAEVLAVARTFGIEPATMVDVLNASTGRSQASEVKYPKHILTHTFDSAFAYDLMVKDLGIAHRLASDLGVVTPITDASYAVVRAAQMQLDPTPADHTELARYAEQLNHVSFARGAS